MKNKVLNIIKNGKLIVNGDKVLAAVSGGPDSMCLIHILNEIKQDIGFDLIAVHVNHLLREDATEDALYVKEFCEKNKISFFLKEINVKEMAQREKIGIEEAARIARYEFFEEIANAENANKIAIAHNKNDVAETLIMNVLRGSGTSGLKSIQKINGKYIRPLIEIKREEIEKYVQENNLNPKIDSTNSDNTYTRNKIRNIVIPYIQKEFNPNIIDGLNRLSEIATDELNFIEKQTNNAFVQTVKSESENEIILDAQIFNSQEIVIKRRLILYTINKLFGTTKNVEKVHIDDIIDLVANNVGNKFLMPNKSLKVYLKQNMVTFTKTVLK